MTMMRRGLQRGHVRARAVFSMVLVLSAIFALINPSEASASTRIARGEFTGDGVTDYVTSEYYNSSNNWVTVIDGRTGAQRSWLVKNRWTALSSLNAALGRNELVFNWYNNTPMVLDYYNGPVWPNVNAGWSTMTITRTTAWAGQDIVFTYGTAVKVYDYQKYCACTVRTYSVASGWLSVQFADLFGTHYNEILLNYYWGGAYHRWVINDNAQAAWWAY